MSIKIEIEAANGADARQQMLDLLGINLGNSASPVVKQTKDEIDAKVHEMATAVKEHYEDTQRLEALRNEEKPEQTPRKRRTRAEIEAANTGVEEPPAAETNAQPAEEETEKKPAEEEIGSSVTAEDLTKKAVELGRAGHRDKVLAVLADQFGGATIAKKDGKPTLAVEQYQAVMDAFNAIG